MSQHYPTANHSRPEFPKRAVVTGGMPYGNKELHFGHIGGVFIQADVFARFLRDRIGKDNVIFVSGTDCYGSPIVEYHRQQLEAGTFEGSLADFVVYNHQRQKKTLTDYNIDISLFAASGFGRSGEIHQQMSAYFFTTLYENGHLKRLATEQFYDPHVNEFLNGRQVVGQCPIQGCRSTKAYADECELGHQYMPRDLLFPKSTLSQQTPEMREVVNWYFTLPAFRKALQNWIQRVEQSPGARRFETASIKEFFEEPIVHVIKKHREEVEALRGELPPHEQKEGQRKSISLRFESLAEREKACAILASHNIQFRSGKTLVPFRLTGNIDWGVPVPAIDGVNDLRFWVWPESLWAPISFTQTYLESQGEAEDAWKNWWCSKDAEIYQFIGEDNVYFYGPAEMAMWMGMQGKNYEDVPPDGELQLPNLVTNRHLLFLNRKASSSDAVKPPMAQALLEHYTPEQLRAHFFSLGLGMKNIGFRPKTFNPNAHAKEADPVLKEGNLLCNVLNRSVRSCFYTIQKYTDGRIPVGQPVAEVIAAGKETILQFERAMHRRIFHQAFLTVDKYIRKINKYWNVNMKQYSFDENPQEFRQILIDVFHMLRVAMTLMHPIAPKGCERIREYLNIGENIWDWKYIFEDLYFFMQDPQQHQPKVLPPRTDFFKKHSSQFAAN